ncbi:MAG: glycosyltransferase family 9 protein [Bryobacteraceae bacterium]
MRKPHSGGRILVVRLGAMGDIVHALPAAASLKHSFPGWQVAWVVEPRWAPLLEGNPFVDRVVLLDRRTGAGLARFWRELRDGRFDFAVDFQGLLKSALVACAARTDRIYGFDRTVVRESLAALFYSDKVAARSIHRVDRNLDLAAAAGASTALHSFPLPAGRAEGELPSGAFVLASPLSGWRSKQWPLDYYARLAQRLRREAGVQLVLNGPPGERDALTGVAGVADTVLHLSSVEGLIDATRRAAAIVGVDSGPLHVAAALGRPGVAIFGPTDPAQTGPYGGTFTVLRGLGAVTSYKRGNEIDASMRAVTPDAVFDALQARMARPHPADCLA